MQKCIYTIRVRGTIKNWCSLLLPLLKLQPPLVPAPVMPHQEEAIPPISLRGWGELCSLWKCKYALRWPGAAISCAGKPLAGDLSAGGEDAHSHAVGSLSHSLSRDRKHGPSSVPSLPHPLSQDSKQRLSPVPGHAHMLMSQMLLLRAGPNRNPSLLDANGP